LLLKILKKRKEKKRKRCYWKGKTQRVISATCKMETSGPAEINVPKREYRHAANTETTPPQPAPGWSLLKLPEALGSVLDLRPEPKFRSGSLFPRPSAPPEAALHKQSQHCSTIGMMPITTYGLHPQALQAMGHDHETHKNGAPNDTEFKTTGFSKLMQIKPGPAVSA
jgi:hypothetical protein